MATSLKRKTITTVEACLENNQSPAICDIIRIIQELASNASTMSIAELADLIGRDPAMVEKVLSAANTLGFKSSIPPVLTISQAIHTIGYEKIRNLAITLIFAENTEEDRNTKEQRDIAALSVSAGVVAKTLHAEEPDGIDPELVFVCASLRSFGKLLLASFIVKDFRKAKRLARFSNEDAAFTEVFGLTPIQLAAAILQNCTIPKAILNTFREVPEDMLEAPATPANRTILISELSTTICRIAYDERLSPSQFQEALHRQLSQYQICLPLETDTVMDALTHLENELSTFNRLMGISDENSSTAKKLKARIAGEWLEKQLESLEPTTAEEIEGQSEEAPEPQKTILEEANQELVKQIDSTEKIDAQKLYESTARAIQDSLHLENCLVFVPEDFEPNKFSARYGIGPLFSKVKNRPLVTVSKNDIFSISINRKEDILIEDINAGKTRSIIPTWITDNSKTNSFVILPTKVDKELFAIIFGAVSHGDPLKIKPTDIKHLKEIRNSLAILKSRVH